MGLWICVLKLFSMYTLYIERKALFFSLNFGQSNFPKQHTVHGSILAARGDGWCRPCCISSREMYWQNSVIPSGFLWGVSHLNSLHTLWRVDAPEASFTRTRRGTLVAPLGTSQGNRILEEAYQCRTDMSINTLSYSRYTFKICGWWWLIRIHSCFYSIIITW